MKKHYVVYEFDLLTRQIGDPLSVHIYLKDAKAIIKAYKRDFPLTNGRYIIIVDKIRGYW